ncbi:MAG: hypothetical protein ACRESV_08875, partial [Nevskiales bacterium]
SLDSVSPIAMPVPPSVPVVDKPLAPEVPRAAVLEEPPKAAVAKNYAVRLQCPLGQEDQWIILPGREESLQQILDTAWDFECPLHGVQRGLPLEASETPLTHLPTPPPMESAGPIEAGVVNAEPWSAGRSSRESRIAQAHRVWVRGVDYKGNPFLQTAFSINISRSGGRLDGLGLLIRPGDTIEVRRLWRKALFRVVWTGQRGTPQANHIGICSLEPNGNFWNLSEAAQSLWRSFAKNTRRSR